MRSTDHVFDRTPLRPERLRRIDGSFAFIQHRFLRHGFWASLEHHELLLYVLLVLVGDKQGMSFYFDERLAGMLRLGLDDFTIARRGLIKRDLIAYDPVGPRYQVLSLPPRPLLLSPALPPATKDPRPPSPSRLKTSRPPRRTSPSPSDTASTHPAPVGQLLREWIAARSGDKKD